MRNKDLGKRRGWLRLGARGADGGDARTDGWPLAPLDPHFLIVAGAIRSVHDAMSRFFWPVLVQCMGEVQWAVLVLGELQGPRGSGDQKCSSCKAGGTVADESVILHRLAFGNK